MALDRKHRAAPWVGLAALLALAGLVRLAWASYQQDFVDSEPITIRSARAGLLMDPGAAVKFRGVVVGRVDSVSPTSDGAELRLNMDPELLEQIPAEVAANIVPPTVFGSKFVELLPRGKATTSQHLVAGAEIDADNVTVEINSTFDTTMRALDALQPAKLNHALTSVASVVEGRGAGIGELLSTTNTYISALQPALADLQRDIRIAQPLLQHYARLTPDFVEAAANAGRIVHALAEQRAQLTAFLKSLTHFGNELTPFLQIVRLPLASTLRLLQPTLELLSEYAATVPCVLGGVARNDKLLTAVLGGPAMGGTHRNAHMTATFGRGIAPYRNPEDLPVVAATGAPDCHGLPVINDIVPYVNFNTGANPYPVGHESSAVGEPPVDVLLFGRTTAGGRAR